MKAYSNLTLLLALGVTTAFAPSSGPRARPSKHSTVVFSSRNGGGGAAGEDALDGTFGGFSAKVRLREEIESPFRQVRLFFFASSAGSALTALYFSALSAVKANIGGYVDAPPLEEALQSCGINAAGAVVCAALAFREYQVGEKNLKRIARGGALARLAVSPASEGPMARRTLSDYRRSSRVMIAAGGPEYISRLCRSLCSDQLADENVLPKKLNEIDCVVVPVLLQKGDKNSIAIGDTSEAWKRTEPEEGDRNFDSTRADSAIAFPRGNAGWEEYLQFDVDTATKQGFDVLEKGITLTVKKNGRILRRATGLPPWGDLIGTMEVMDGSKFGMPGDSERYGGP